MTPTGRVFRVLSIILLTSSFLCWASWDWRIRIGLWPPVVNVVDCQCWVRERVSE